MNSFTSKLAGLFVFLSFVFSGLSLEANTKNAKPIAKNFEKSETIVVKTFTDAEYKAELSKARDFAKENSRNSRKIASRINEEAALSCDFRNLRNRIIGGPACSETEAKVADHPITSSAEQMAAIVKDANDEKFYENLDNDAKLLAAQIALMAPMRGILYRSRGLVEDYKLAHSMVLTAIRMAATGVTIYSTDDTWKAGIKYFGDPFQGIQNLPAIHNDESFNQFLGTELQNSVLKFRNRIAKLDFNNGIRFDAKVAFGEAEFTDEQDRYFSMGYPEQMAMIGGADLALSGIQASKAYVWQGFFEAIQNVAQVYGYDSFSPSRLLQIKSVEGSTAQKRVSVIRKKSPNLGKFRPGSEAELQAAYPLLKNGIQSLRIAWEAVDGRSERLDRVGIRQFMDPRFFAPFTRMTRETFDNLLALLDDQPVTSAIFQGEVVQVNVRALFGMDRSVSPPNLQDFLPTGFNKEPFETSKNGFEYHNYLSGSPVSWNSNHYQKYFPLSNGETKLTNEGIKLRARVLNQTWGGLAVGAPIMAALF